MTFIDNYGREVLYSGSDIRDMYRYLDMIGDPTTLDYSSKTSYCDDTNTNKFSVPLHKVISEQRHRQRILCE